MSSPIKELENLGWGINTDALRKYCGDDYKDSLTSTEIQKMILDIDIKVYGKCILQNALDKQKGVLKGPIVLQLSKWRNISHADGFDDHYDSKKDYARMTLTDGITTVNGINFDLLTDINGKTSPGTKILFKDNVEYSDGLLLLSNKNVEVLGGNVDKMIEKWKMEKMINNSVGKIPKTKAPQWKPFLNTVKVVNAPKNDGNKLVNDTNNAKQRQIFTSDSKSSVSKNERKCLVSKNETKSAVSKNDAKLVGSKNDAKSLVPKNNVKLLVSKNEIKPIQNDSKAFISKNGTKALVNKNNNDSDHFAKSNINQNTLNPPKSTTSLSQAKTTVLSSNESGNKKAGNMQGSQGSSDNRKTFEKSPRKEKTFVDSHLGGDRAKIQAIKRESSNQNNNERGSFPNTINLSQTINYPKPLNSKPATQGVVFKSEQGFNQRVANNQRLAAGRGSGHPSQSTQNVPPYISNSAFVPPPIFNQPPPPFVAVVPQNIVPNVIVRQDTSHQQHSAVQQNSTAQQNSNVQQPNPTYHHGQNAQGNEDYRKSNYQKDPPITQHNVSLKKVSNTQNFSTNSNIQHSSSSQSIPNIQPNPTLQKSSSLHSNPSVQTDANKKTEIDSSALKISKVPHDEGVVFKDGLVYSKGAAYIPTVAYELGIIPNPDPEYNEQPTVLNQFADTYNEPGYYNAEGGYDQNVYFNTLVDPYQQHSLSNQQILYPQPAPPMQPVPYPQQNQQIKPLGAYLQQDQQIMQKEGNPQQVPYVQQIPYAPHVMYEQGQSGQQIQYQQDVANKQNLYPKGSSSQQLQYQQVQNQQVQNQQGPYQQSSSSTQQVSHAQGSSNQKMAYNQQSSSSRQGQYNKQSSYNKREDHSQPGYPSRKQHDNFQHDLEQNYQKMSLNNQKDGVALQPHISNKTVKFFPKPRNEKNPKPRRNSREGYCKSDIHEIFYQPLQKEATESDKNKTGEVQFIPTFEINVAAEEAKRLREQKAKAKHGSKNERK